MFDPVDKKLERAQYFLDQIKALALGAPSWRACLDGFFFELISAKDMFLQSIADKYKAGLKRDEATNFARLKTALVLDSQVCDVIEDVERKISNTTTWLWNINNYRNCATHRELLNFGFVYDSEVKVYLFKDPEYPGKGNLTIDVFDYCGQNLYEMRKYLEELFNKLP